MYRNLAACRPPLHPCHSNGHGIQFPTQSCGRFQLVLHMKMFLVVVQLHLDRLKKKQFTVRVRSPYRKVLCSALFHAYPNSQVSMNICIPKDIVNSQHMHKRGFLNSFGNIGS